MRPVTADKPSNPVFFKKHLCLCVFSEVHRTRLDHDIDLERWTFTHNWVQCDVNSLSRNINDVLFEDAYEKICEACLRRP